MNFDEAYTFLEQRISYALEGPHHDIRKKRPLAELLSTGYEIYLEALKCETTATQVPLQCIEATLLSMYITTSTTPTVEETLSLVRFPISFQSTTKEGQDYFHQVLGVFNKTSQCYGALGVSRQSELGSHPCRYPTLADIINKYKKCYHAAGHTLVSTKIGREVPHSYSVDTEVVWTQQTFYTDVSAEDWTRSFQEFETILLKRQRNTIWRSPTGPYRGQPGSRRTSFQTGSSSAGGAGAVGGNTSSSPATPGSTQGSTTSPTFLDPNAMQSVHPAGTTESVLSLTTEHDPNATEVVSMCSTPRLPSTSTMLLIQQFARALCSEHYVSLLRRESSERSKILFQEKMAWDVVRIRYRGATNGPWIRNMKEIQEVGPLAASRVVAVFSPYNRGANDSCFQAAIEQVTAASPTEWPNSIEFPESAISISITLSRSVWIQHICVIANAEVVTLVTKAGQKIPFRAMRPDKEKPWWILYLDARSTDVTTFGSVLLAFKKEKKWRKNNNVRICSVGMYLSDCKGRGLFVQPKVVVTPQSPQGLLLK
eukprot:PhF_6_TR22523/c0_g1_i1/m.31973